MFNSVSFRMSGSSQNLEDELALVSVNESNSSTYDILLKIMALGDTGVGKSCFLVQYVEGRFMMKYVTTVGVDFFLRKLVSYFLRTLVLKIWNSQNFFPITRHLSVGFHLKRY